MVHIQKENKKRVANLICELIADEENEKNIERRWQTRTSSSEYHRCNAAHEYV